MATAATRVATERPALRSWREFLARSAMASAASRRAAARRWVDLSVRAFVLDAERELLLVVTRAVATDAVTAEISELARACWAAYNGNGDAGEASNGD